MKAPTLEFRDPVDRPRRHPGYRDRRDGPRYLSNQLEIISSEQMLDACSSVGMPLMYQHWSFGKRFIYEDSLYRKGCRGHNAEIVINSNPCIACLMEENTMAMQTLVIAHASFGHNHFFKNIPVPPVDGCGAISYMDFAKYIAKCEERHGTGGSRSNPRRFSPCADGQWCLPLPPPPRLSSEKVREERVNDWNARSRPIATSGAPCPPPPTAVLIPTRRSAMPSERKRRSTCRRRAFLYFIEKHSLISEPWQREILGIVRIIAQYFYPQRQTKVMNEGCATYVHYAIINRLFDRGKISEATCWSS